MSSSASSPIVVADLSDIINATSTLLYQPLSSMLHQPSSSILRQTSSSMLHQPSSSILRQTSSSMIHQQSSLMLHHSSSSLCSGIHCMSDAIRIVASGYPQFIHFLANPRLLLPLSTFMRLAPPPIPSFSCWTIVGISSLAAYE